MRQKISNFLKTLSICAKILHVIDFCFLSCVNLHMCLKIKYSAKRMITMGTFIGFFPCMNSFMLLQAAILSKSFWTLRTAVGFLPSVTYHMSAHGVRLREFLITMCAAIGFLPCMHLQVRSQSSCKHLEH
jgi:hypothetical protein